MPYPAEHKQTTRTKILDSARRLFNRNGLSEISIDEIMAGAGLTRGGFYSYFASKEELYAEAITHFVTCQVPASAWQHDAMQNVAQSAAAGHPPSQAIARAILDAYLSRQHLEDVDNSCPMIGLATDVARGGAATKAAYRQVMAMMTDIFAGALGADAFAAGARAPDPEADRARALAVTALCVGGMVLARAIDDPGLADELRNAAHEYAVALAGWRGVRATGDA